MRFDETWIYDSDLKLFWSPTVEKSMTWGQSVEYAKAHDADLPTVKELLTLIDYSQYDPCIVPGLLKTHRRDWYWTGTERMVKTDEAYAISFVGGCCIGAAKEGEKSFRMVRRIK